MKKIRIISTITSIVFLTIILPVRAQISDTDKEKVMYLMSDDKLIISFNMKTNYACAVTKNNSILKFAVRKIQNLKNDYKEISGTIEHSLSFRNNRITNTTGQFTAKGKLYTADWLIINTEFYSESLYEMADCTTGGGLARLRKFDY